jgi:transposase-like protein
MRGRKPSGPEYVQRLEGSARAKERAEAVLATLGGRISVQEACRRLGVGEAYFNRLRVKFLRGGLPALEDQPAGRRRRPVSAAEEQIGRLETALGEARLALQAAQVREEIALTMPQLLTSAAGRVAWQPNKRCASWSNRSAKAYWTSADKRPRRGSARPRRRTG